jgi:RNase P/RNase MRP subunit POP5
MVRIKHRYIVGQILFDPNVEVQEGTQGRDIVSAIREKVQILYGDVGLGEFGVSTVIKYYDQSGIDSSTQLFVIRTAREAVDNLLFVMSNITTIRKNTVVLRSLDVCGSVRTCMASMRNLIGIAVDASHAMDNDAKEAKKKRLVGILEDTLE